MSNQPKDENKYAIKVRVNEDGKLAIKAKDAIEIWKDFQAEFWANRISTIGLVGNRQALNQKFAIYQAFLGQEERTQPAFIRLCKTAGYRNETIQELWLDFINVFQPDFVNWLKEKMNPTTKKKDNDELVF